MRKCNGKAIKSVLSFMLSIFMLISGTLSCYASLPTTVENDYEAVQTGNLPDGLGVSDFLWPNESGRYTYKYEGATVGNEYALFVVDGYYDHLSSEDINALKSDLLYINQLTAESTEVVFSEFVPTKVKESTVLLSDSSSTPRVVGYISDKYFSVKRYCFTESGNGIPEDYYFENGISETELLTALPGSAYAELISYYGKKAYVPVVIDWSIGDSINMNEVDSFGVATGVVSINDSFLDASLKTILPDAKVNINIVSNDSKIVSISATKTKIVYNVGDTVLDTDVCVNATYEDGTVRVLSGWTSNIDKVSCDTEGTFSLVITYGEFSTSIGIVVLADEESYYQVSFETNGGSYIAPILVEDYLLAYPENPTRKGYRFSGWYTDSECLDPFSLNTVIDKDITLYAAWKDELAIHPTGMDVSLSRTEYDLGEELSKNDLTVYLIYSDGTRVVVTDYETNLNEVDQTKAGKKTFKVTLYAQGTTYTQYLTFSIIESDTTIRYIVDFESGCETLVESQLVLAGETVVEPEPIDRPGFEFIGWYYKTEKWSFTKKVTKDMVLTAKWGVKTQIDDSGDIFVYTEGDLEYPYTGSAIKPSIIVMDRNHNILKKNKDFTLGYSNNKEVSTETSPAYIEIKGKGSYSGKLSVPFMILSKDISDADIKATLANSFAYVPSGINPIPTVKHGKLKLVKDKDFVVTAEWIDGDIRDDVRYPITEAGKYCVTIKGIGNYKGTRSFDVVYGAKDFVSISSLKIKVDNLGKTVGYTGKPILIDQYVHVTNSKTKEEYSSDEYYLEYADDHTSPGIVTVWIKAKANSSKLYGSKSFTFKIQGVSIKNATVAVSSSSVGYDGNLKNNNLKAVKIKVTKANSKLIASATGENLTNGTFYELKKEKDYTVEYLKNHNSGTANIKITGKGLFTGSINKTFKIAKKSLKDDDISIVISNVIYRKNAAIPNVVVKYNCEGALKILVEGRDYVMSCKNNKTVTDSAKVTLKGKGNYTGEVTYTYGITEKNLKDTDIRIVANNMPYNKKAKANYTYKPAITVFDKGIKLTKNKDYTIDYSKCIKSSDISEDITEGYVVINAKGKNYVGNIEVPYKVSKKIISASAYSFNIDDQIYTGSSITFNVNDSDVVKMFKGLCVENGTTEQLLIGKDYEIVSYKANKNVGTASVVIRGIGDYSGERTVKFKIKKCPIGK